jgi:hypothetical protein
VARRVGWEPDQALPVTVDSGFVPSSAAGNRALPPGSDDTRPCVGFDPLQPFVRWMAAAPRRVVQKVAASRLGFGIRGGGFFVAHCLQGRLGGLAGVGIAGSSRGQQLVQQVVDRQAGAGCGLADGGLPLPSGSRGDDSGEIGGGCDAGRLREAVVHHGVAEAVRVVECCGQGGRAAAGEELGGVGVRG